MDITLTITIHADRLADLGNFLLEREPAPAAPVTPTPYPTEEAVIETLGDEKPTKPVKPKRKRRTNAEIAADKAAAEAEAAPPAVELPTVEAPVPAIELPTVEMPTIDMPEVDMPVALTEDDIRKAVRACVETHGLDRVGEVFAKVGASCMSDLKPTDYARVIALMGAI